jgi:hypothetical protein
MGEVLPAAQPIEDPAAWSISGTDRTRPDFGAPSFPKVKLRRT